MKLSLASLKVHLAHCALHPATGRSIGLIFTRTGIPALAAAPVHH
jgi:hypothetical protein